MTVETLEDIVESLADQLGVYGAHTEGETRECRVCFTSQLTERIERAVKRVTHEENLKRLDVLQQTIDARLTEIERKLNA